MFDARTAARLEAIGKLGFTNPFGPERPELEAVIVLDPAQTQVTGGYIWSNVKQAPQVEAQLWESLQSRAEARTTYDVPRTPMWGWIPILELHG